MWPLMPLCSGTQSCLHVSCHTIIYLLRQLSHHHLSLQIRDALQLCFSRDQLRCDAEKSYCWMKEPANKENFIDFQTSETKRDLHIGLWYHQWHYIMLSICLSLPFLPRSSLWYFHSCKRKMENKLSLFPHVHMGMTLVTMLFPVWVDVFHSS